MENYFAGCSSSDSCYCIRAEREGSSEAVQEVETAKAEKGNITAELETSGTIDSEDVRTYSSPVNAEIVTANLQVGKPVKKGESLVTFDTCFFRKKL